MNTDNNIIRLLFIIFFVSATQKTTAQESELNETMRRWLREQNERTIEPDFRLPQQQQQPFLNFPQIQHQLQQPEVLRISPTTRLPTYLDRLQISDSTELILLRNMFDNLSPETLSTVRIAPFNSPHFVPERLGIRNVLAGEGEGPPLPCPDLIRAERQRARLIEMGIEPMPTRLEVREIYELNERTNQLIREARENEKD